MNNIVGFELQVDYILKILGTVCVNSQNIRYVRVNYDGYRIRSSDNSRIEQTIRINIHEVCSGIKNNKNR